MNPLNHLFPGAAPEFQRFFEALGYRVYWEGRRETGERWYEICDDAGLAFQISMPPPSIEELIADLPHLIENNRGVGASNYWLACEDPAKLRELQRRVQAS